MITHNGIYLPFATHHGMPIVAATMGGKMILDGKWLQPATQLAIVAAFGAEGTEVIAKTNDYLNQIATTDPQRALLLVNFINEDPMLVCSLVETSKTRWLVGDDGGYINTGYIRNTNSKLICDMSSLDGRDVAFLGTRGSAYLFYNFSGNYFYPISRCDNIQGILVIGNKYHMEWDSTDFILTGDDGVYQSAKRNITNQNLPMYIFNFNPLDSRYAYARIANFIIEENGTKIIEMYPFHRNGENGMLDIISGTFYPNANTEGSFTIALTPAPTS